jgi:8-amino-7-oxononanoate synthase
MSGDPLGRVRAALAAREAAGLSRMLRPRPAAEDVLDLASNDYLGLCRDQRVTSAAAEAARTWGAGSTGSRLVTGTIELHRELEDALAGFTGAAAALVFSSGYLANLGAIATLGGPDVTVISDSVNHASIVDACRLSRSAVVITEHRAVEKVAAALETADTEHALVITDAVFSVDGDLAPLAELHAVTRAHRALLIVDEAHALGVIGDRGEGAVAAAGLAGQPDIVQTLTLSKSLGSQGGAVLGEPEIVELLVNTARAFIFDTALAPAPAAAALAALRILQDEPERAGAVRANARALADLVRDLGVETVRPDAAVVPAVLGDPRRAVLAAARCLELGVRVGCFRPPSVAPDRSCLRLTARADLSAADLQRAGAVLGQALG